MIYSYYRQSCSEVCNATALYGQLDWAMRWHHHVNRNSRIHNRYLSHWKMWKASSQREKNSTQLYCILQNWANFIFYSFSWGGGSVGSFTTIFLYLWKIWNKKNGKIKSVRHQIEANIKSLSYILLIPKIPHYFSVLYTVI